MINFLTRIPGCGSHSLLIWICFFPLTLVFVLLWLSLRREILIMLLSQFPLTFLQTQKGMSLFTYYAPIKKIYLRTNEAPFMTKKLHNAILKGSRYMNKFLKDKSQTSRENYEIQRNFCKKL